MIRLFNKYTRVNFKNIKNNMGWFTEKNACVHTHSEPVLFTDMK